MVSKFSVRRPYTVLVGVILVLILGYVSLTRMTADLLPNLELPYAVVVTTYPGASPETVESTLTSPIEKSMATLSNIENIQSISSENYSVVILEFADSTNMDSISLDMREKLDQLESSWTDDMIGSPTIMKLNPNMMPIMVAGAASDEYDNAVDFTEFVEKEILPELQSVEGVASVSAGGEMEEQINVILSQDKIDKLNKRIHKALDGQFEDAEEKIKDAQAELDDGKQQLEDSKSQLNSQTEQMGSQLGQGQSELTQQQSSLMKSQADMEKQLATVEEKLAELKSSKADLEKQKSTLVSNKKALQSQKKELQAQKKELESNITTLKTLPAQLEQVNAAVSQLETSKEQLELMGDAGAEQLAQVNAQLAELYTTQTALQEQVTNMDATLEQLTQGLAQIEDAIKQIDDGLTQINDGLPQIEDGIKQIEAGIPQVESAKKQLEDGLKQIKAGQSTVKETLAKLNASSISGSIQMAVGLSQITSGLSQIEDGQKQLDASKDELEDAKQNAYDSSDMNEILTISLLSQLLQAQNFSMPAGYVVEDNKQILVRVGDKAEDTEDMEKIVLMDLHMDNISAIRLSDVADVVVTNNSDETYANVNGKPGILFTMEKQTGYSTGNVSKALEKRFAELEEEHEGLHFISLMDQGDYIEIIIDSIFKSLIFGALLAMLILLIFLKDLRPTIMVAVSIPLSLLTCIVCMYFSGISLNMISLSALALAVGMLVDNSIVVIENIYRLRNMGVSAKMAAVEGAKQVAGAITASTLTTVCVFLPIVFTEGITRQLFVDMGLTMGYSLIASLFIALTLIPALSASVLKTTKQKPDRILGGVLNVYERMIRWCLRFKPVVLILALVLLVSSILLSVSRGTALLPDMTGNQATVTISVDENKSFEDLTNAAQALSENIMEIEGVSDVGVSAGATGGSMLMSMLMGSGSSNSCSMYVILDEHASFNGDELKQNIEAAAEDIDCTVEVSTNTMDLSMLSSGAKIQVEARDLDKLTSAAEDIAKILEGVEGLTNVSSGVGETTDEFRITVNEKKAAKYGLTTAQIFQAISAELADESSVTTLSAADKDYDVYVLDGSKKDMTIKRLKKLKLKGTDKDKKEVKVALKKVADFSDGKGMNSINRVNQTRTLSVTADFADGYNVGLVSQDINKAMEDYETPENVTWYMDGENEYIMDAFEQIILMLVLAIAFMYLIMVAQFQSLLSPFIILFTIPLAFTGGFLGLYLSGSPVSMIAMIGFVMLSGVIVNNGIVMVDYINQLRYTGMDKREAIVEAGRTRLRPILMTALTTILAMSTMMTGNDLGVALGKPMTVVSIGGLLYGTLLTLFVVPCVYDLLNRKKEMKDPFAELDHFEEEEDSCL